MRFLLSVILICAPVCDARAQILVSIIGGQAAGAASYTCGNTVTSGSTLQSSVNNIAIFTPCTTGSDVNGYSVSAVYTYVGTAGGNIYTAIYSNTTSLCSSGSNCPDVAVCSDSTGVAATASSFNLDTPGSCGTLSANTTYWVGRNTNNASQQTAYTATSPCPAPLTPSVRSNTRSGVTAGTWGSMSGGVSASSACYLVYMVLTPL